MISYTNNAIVYDVKYMQSTSYTTSMSGMMSVSHTCFLIWRTYRSSLLLSVHTGFVSARSCDRRDRQWESQVSCLQQMLGAVWMKLRNNRLASIKSDTSMIEVSSDYASHFYDMYFQKHDGKHLTGDRMKIQMLNIPFVMRDLIAEEAQTFLLIRSGSFAASLFFKLAAFLGLLLCWHNCWLCTCRSHSFEV